MLDGAQHQTQQTGVPSGVAAHQQAHHQQQHPQQKPMAATTEPSLLPHTAGVPPGMASMDAYANSPYAAAGAGAAYAGIFARPLMAFQPFGVGAVNQNYLGFGTTPAAFVAASVAAANARQQLQQQVCVRVVCVCVCVCVCVRACVCAFVFVCPALELVVSLCGRILGGLLLRGE